MKIFKYTLPPALKSEVLLPEGGKVLSCGAQGDYLVVWALVDPDKTPTMRTFRVFGTGMEIQPKDNWRFIGTAQMDVGLVWHIYEVGHGD